MTAIPANHQTSRAGIYDRQRPRRQASGVDDSVLAPALVQRFLNAHCIPENCQHGHSEHEVLLCIAKMSVRMDVHRARDAEAPGRALAA